MSKDKEIVLYGKIEDLKDSDITINLEMDGDKLRETLNKAQALRTLEINPVSEVVPNYECVVQYLTFSGESLPDVLRRIANYIDKNYSSTSNVVIDIEQDEDGMWIASFGYGYEHFTLEQCKKALKEK